jgi:ATP/maltotriose-dependent transcriptional regulator MalT
MTDRGHLSGYLALSGQFAAVRAHAERYQSGIERSGLTEQTISTNIHAWGLAHVAAFEGDPDGARRNLEDARASANDFGSHFTSTTAIDPELWLVLRPYLTDVRTAWDVAVARIEENRRRGVAVGAFDDHREPAASWRLTITSMGGSWDEALHLANQMLGSASWFSRFHAQWCIGAIAREQGNRELAWQMIHATWPIGFVEEPGNQMIVYTISMLRLATSLALDDADVSTARDWLEAHDRWLSWMGATLGQSESHGLWARLERIAGNLEKADQHAHQAVAHASDPRQPLALLAAHRCLGALETQAARYDAAEKRLDLSLRLADACDMPYERALTLLEYAELWSATQHAERFSQAIADVRAICQPLGATRALRRAERLSASLAIVPSVSRQHPAGLSNREVEVLRLLAAGLTNREIAARLFVSPYTVKRHVSNILTKIDVTTRAAAARFAADHGLT